LKNGQMVPGARLGFDYLPNTTDWYGRWRLTQNPSNDWMIDRAVQQSGESFTGIASIHGQDQAVTESMGGITDHDFENLGPSDIMIARTRRRLLRAARALGKDGTVPPGVDDPDMYTAVRSGDFLADEKIAWRDAYEMQMRAAVRPLAEAAE
jgi:phthalate 4,5-dioxygenase